jgi:hypothetical protein
MDTAFFKLLDFGAIGIIAAICLWQVFAISNKLFNVIENNTKALAELKELIKNKCMRER